MLKYLTIALMAILLTGCGDAFQLPSNQKGFYIDADSGLDTSKSYSGQSIYIPWYWIEHDAMVAAETSQGVYDFTAEVPINESNGLPVTFGFNVVFQLDDDDDALIDAIGRYPAIAEHQFLRVITADQMAKTSIAPIAVDTASNTINGLGLSIEDIMLNMPSVRLAVAESFCETMKSTPLKIIAVTMDNPQWPESVVARKEERQRIIDEEQIQIERIDMERRNLEKTHNFAILKAEKDLELDGIYAERFKGEYGDELLRQQVLEILDKCADNEGGCNVVMTEGLAPWSK